MQQPEGSGRSGASAFRRISSSSVHRLLRWYRDGVDVQSRLPALSTFLGHANPQATEVYLTITADLLREANARRFGATDFRATGDEGELDDLQGSDVRSLREEIG